MQNDINKKDSEETELGTDNNRSPLEQSMEHGMDSKNEEVPSSPPLEQSENVQPVLNDPVVSPQSNSENELPGGLNSTSEQENEFKSEPEVKEEIKPLEPVTEEQPEAVSSTPDTDQFLKSIMDEDSPLPDDSQVSPNSPTTPVKPDIETKIDEPQPKSEEKSFNLDDLKVEDPVTEPMPKEDFATNISPVENQPEKASNINLDNIKKPEEEEDHNDNMIQSSTIKRKTGTSLIKLISAVVLSILIVALGYYAYSTFFPSSSGFEAQESETSFNDFDSSPKETAISDETNSFLTLDEQRKSDLSQISNALTSYYDEFGSFPTSEKLTLLNSGNVLEYALVPGHLKQMPYDPNPVNSYGYRSDGSTFTLSAILDDPSDSQAVIESGKAIFYIEYPTSQTATTTDSALSENMESNTSLSDDSLVPEEDQNGLLNL